MRKALLVFTLALAGLTLVQTESSLLAKSNKHQPARSLLFPSDSTKTDPETGLAIDDQLMLVKGQCTACHSSKLILQSHFSRDKWIERIRWMQRTQNLWDLGESEPAILAYLIKHYGPTERSPTERSPTERSPTERSPTERSPTEPQRRTGTSDGRRKPLNAVQWYKLNN